MMARVFPVPVGNPYAHRPVSVPSAKRVIPPMRINRACLCSLFSLFPNRSSEAMRFWCACSVSSCVFMIQLSFLKEVKADIESGDVVSVAHGTRRLPSIVFVELIASREVQVTAQEHLGVLWCG